MSGHGQALSVAILSVGVIALGATQYLGTPWAGVALCGLSALPWGVEAWLGRGQGPERRTIDAMAELLNKHATMHLQVAGRLEEQSQQINSLRSNISARGVMGG